MARLVNLCYEVLALAEGGTKCIHAYSGESDPLAS